MDRSKTCRCRNRQLQKHRNSQMLLPQQLAVWRRDTERTEVSATHHSAKPRPLGSLFWLTIRSALPYDPARAHVTFALHGPLSFEPNTPVTESVRCCTKPKRTPEKMLGSWVGALGSWCHCPLEVGVNLKNTRRCGKTTLANPSDGRSGYCVPCFQTTSRKPALEERREGGSKPQKDKPDTPPAGAGT